MSRAYGSRAQLLGKEESAYGTAPSGNYAKLPFISASLGPAQPLIADDTVGNGRHALDPSYDVLTVDGDVVVPLDLRNVGFWLNGLLGAESVSGTSPYTHVWKSGASSLPSLSLEIGNPEVPSFRNHLGVIVNTMQVELATSGNARLTFGLLAQGVAEATTTAGGTPTTATYARFSQFQGSIAMGGSALGNVTGGGFTFSNGAEAVRTIRSDKKLEGVDPSICTLTGNIKVRFADTTLLDAATAGDPVALSMAYTIDADNKITFDLPRVFLPRPKLPITGPGGIEAQFDFQAAYDATATALLEATLINDVATY